ncbi:env p15E protein fragment [Abelson murine leukemia virus]|nr:env p15E protein fragment [Abelson murine leukemia virus]
MGPLIVLLMILLFGPCILNRLVQFVKDRISVVQALVLTQQYHQLKPIEYEP